MAQVQVVDSKQTALESILEELFGLACIQRDHLFPFFHQYGVENKPSV